MMTPDYTAEQYSENPKDLFAKIDAMPIETLRKRLKAIADDAFSDIGNGWSTMACFGVLDLIDDGTRGDTWEEP